MRGLSSVFVGLLVVMASCGSSPDGQSDTEGVAERTPVPSFDEAPNPARPEAAPLPAPPVATGPAVMGGTSVGFAAGTRFILFANDGGPSFVVFDRDRGETFHVLGAPLGRTRSTFEYVEMGLAAGALRWDLQSARDGRILVRSAGGVQLVDLAHRGHMIAAWRGTPVTTSIAPDGKSFAVTTADAMHLVRASDGAIASFAGAFGESDPNVQWGDKNVHWSIGNHLKRVDRETLKATTIRAQGESPKFAASSEATVVAVAAGGTVAVYTEGDAKPILTVPAPDLAEVVVQADGANVVWIERTYDEENFSDRGHLHAIDVTAKTHVRFAMKNSGCTTAPEVLTEVKGAKITTDPSCAIGCPSVRWTHRTLTYDAKTGAIVEETSYTEEQSYNEEQSALREEVEKAAKKLETDLLDMTHRPKHDSFLLRKDEGLVLASPKSNDRIGLEASKGAGLATLAFSRDGALVAGTVGDRARVWDAATGRALLR